MQSSHSRRTYDYRIQEAICESGDRDLFPGLEIPRSTIRSWIHRGVPDVVTCDLVVRDRAELLAEIRQYRQRTAMLGAIVGLLIAMLRVSKNRLDNFTALHRLIDFYVTAHNEVMPHSAFDGQTPDEMNFGTGDAVAAELASAREAAREERMKANRAAACSVCFGETDSTALLLQRPRCRML